MDEFNDGQIKDGQIQIKGGAGLFNPTNIFDYLETKHRLGELVVTPFGTTSVGGYIFKIVVQNPEPHFLKIHPGEAEPLSPMTHIIIKLIQIRDRNDRVGTNSFNSKEIVPQSTFEQEVRIQTNLFENSFDMYCEPICPQIFKSGYIYNNSTEFTQLSTISTDISTVLNLNFNSLFGRNAEKMGYICMELMGNTKPVKAVFPDWETSPYITAKDQLSAVQKTILDNYFYQLVRMKNLGYSHRDIHLENALYLENYDYIDNYRVYIIDFGRTTPIVSTDSHRDQLVSTIPWLVDWWSYKQMIDYITTIDNDVGIIEYYNSLRKKRRASIDRFIEKLYLNTSHFESLKQIVPIIKPIPRPTDFQYTNIFEHHQIPLRNVDGMILGNDNKVSINTECNCCPFFDPKRNDTYYVKPGALYYDQKLITVLNESNLLKTYVNESLHNYRYAHGIFNWIIGIDAATQQPRFYCILVNNCFEIGVKHVSLLQYHGISQIYAAGNMYKMNDTVYLNLLSGTYMLAAIQNGDLTNAHMEKLANILKPFVYDKINHGVERANALQVSVLPNKKIIRKSLFCANPDLLNIQVNTFIKYNEYVFPIYNQYLFIAYPDEASCNQDVIIGGREPRAFLEPVRAEPFGLFQKQDEVLQKEEIKFEAKPDIQEKKLKSKFKFNLEEYTKMNDKNDTYLGKQELNTISLPSHEMSHKQIQKIKENMVNHRFKENLSIVIHYVMDARKNARKACINTLLLEDEDIKEKLSSRKIQVQKRKPKIRTTRRTKKSAKTRKRRHSAP